MPAEQLPSHEDDIVLADYRLLGQVAVQAAEEQVAYELSGENTAVIDPVEVTRGQTDLAETRAMFQELVNSSNIDAYRKTSDYFNSVDDMPPIFEDWRKDPTSKEEKSIDWPVWLAEETSDEQLLNFMQWHTNRIEKISKDPQLLEKIEDCRASFINEVNNLYETGILDQTAQVKSVQEVQEATVTMVDPLRLAVLDQRAIAGYDKGRAIILISPENVTENASTLDHEFAHFIERIPNDGPMAETGADYVAAAVRTGSTDPAVLLAELQSHPSGYTAVDEYWDMAFSGANGVDPKLFLRYVSLPNKPNTDALDDALSNRFRQPNGLGLMQDALAREFDERGYHQDRAS